MGIPLRQWISLPLCRHGKRLLKFTAATLGFTLLLLVLEDILLLPPTDEITKNTEIGLSVPGAVIVRKSTYSPNKIIEKRRKQPMLNEHTIHSSGLKKTSATIYSLLNPTFTVLLHPAPTVLYHPTPSILYHPTPSDLYHPTPFIMYHPNPSVWVQSKCRYPKQLTPAKCDIYNKIVQNFTIHKGDTRDNIINLHRYDYVIDSTACQRESPQAVLVVHSKFDHYQRREVIRSTWAHNRTVMGLLVTTVFVLGQPAVNKRQTPENITLGADDQEMMQQKDILNSLARNVQEAKKFRDIVMGNFTDIYRNLTRKHVVALGWVLSHCPKVKYIVKLDDDVIVNVYNLARHIKKTKGGAEKTIVCRVPKNLQVHRKKSSKWSVSMKEYPFQVYPPYCLGFGIFMTRDIAMRLYETTRDVRPLWIDDVYMTGLVAWKAGITLKDFHGNLTVAFKNVYNPQHKNAMFVMARFDSQHTYRKYWSDLVAAEG